MLGLRRLVPVLLPPPGRVNQARQDSRGAAFHRGATAGTGPPRGYATGFGPARTAHPQDRGESSVIAAWRPGNSCPAPAGFGGPAPVRGTGGRDIRPRTRAGHHGQGRPTTKAEASAVVRTSWRKGKGGGGIGGLPHPPTPARRPQAEALSPAGAAPPRRWGRHSCQGGRRLSKKAPIPAGASSPSQQATNSAMEVSITSGVMAGPR